MTNDHSRVFPIKRDWYLLAGGMLLLFAFCLGTRGLNEPDEGRYTNIARAMVLNGDWWEPRMSGYGHYDKPPLIYWMTALSLRAFGMNEWAARVPSFLGAMFSLAGLGWAAFRLRGAVVAWWAVLICGTCVQFYVLGRILSPDMLLTAWCTLAVAAWAETRHRAGAWNWWLLSLVFWTLAWWTKATPALIPLAGLLVGVLVTRDLAGKRALRIWLLFPAVLVLGAAWFLSMMSQYPELQNFFFGRELAGRIAGRVDGRHGSKIYILAKSYYLLVSLVGWFPWWPLAAWSAWKQRERLRTVPGVPALRTWCLRFGVEGWIVATGLIIFSLAASKLPTYTLTLAPWAALGMARLVVGAVAFPAVSNRVLTSPAGIVAGGFALLTAAAVLLIPHYETRLGVNSSLRTVCAFLRAKGAERVDADQYWPGMEFYLGDNAVHYVMNDKHQQERQSDPGLPPDRYIDPDHWPALDGSVSPPFAATGKGDVWLVRFRKRKDSPFDDLVSPENRRVLAKTFGQFDVIRTRIEADGKLTPVSITP